MELSFPTEEYNLKYFDLEILRRALEKNLTEFFVDVKVEVEECPDLSVPPFSLATSSFGGGMTGLIDLGGVPYLLPLVDRSRVYDMETVIPKCIGTKDYPNGWYVSGAAAGPWPSQGVNCEMVLNMKIGVHGKCVNNKSRVALIGSKCDGTKNDIVVNHLDTETRCALLANLMVSSGVKGKVLKIKCGKRINKDSNFTTSIRKALIKDFGSEPIGLGGLFLLYNSPSKNHIMRDFSKTPLNTDDDVNQWLRFFEFDPPMLFQSVLITSDPNLDLRVEHSHGWNIDGKVEVGHYHYDVAPDTAEYVGYYVLAQKIYRIDRPKVTHNVGRD